MVLSNYEFYVNCFKKVVVGGEKFYNIINKDIKNFDATAIEKTHAQAIIGSCLRHYLFLVYTLKEKLKINDSDLMHVLIYLLNDYYFTKRFTYEDYVDTIKDYSSKHNIEVDIDAIFKHFEGKTTFDLLRDDFPNNINNKYLSLRYNVPAWIAGMLAKQYSPTTAIKTLKAFSNKQKYYVKVNNTFRTSQNPITLSESEFKLYKDDIYEFIGKGALRKHRLVNNFTLYTTNFLDNEIIKKIRINTGDSIAVYDDTKTNLIIELYNNALKQNTFNFFSSDYSRLMKTLEYLRKFKHDRLFYDQCEVDVLAPRISRKVNLFLLVPRSSNFSNVNSSPEYLINFDQNSLTDLINYQAKAIKSAAEHVLIGGNLVYVTYTLNRKENDNIVAEFLKEHPGWSLQEEKTHFTSANDVTCGYYAILHREF